MIDMFSNCIILFLRIPSLFRFHFIYDIGEIKVNFI